MDYFSKTLVDPDKAVCYGARKYMKAVLDGREERLKTKIPNPIGIVLKSPDGTDRFRQLIGRNVTLPMRRPISMRDPVTNVIAGKKELVFLVQEGYSENPKDNSTIGKITIPLPDEIAAVPGSGLFYIKIGADENGIIYVSIKNNSPGSAGEVIDKVFKHDEDATIELEGVEAVKVQSSLFSDSNKPDKIVIKKRSRRRTSAQSEANDTATETTDNDASTNTTADDIVSDLKGGLSF